MNGIRGLAMALLVGGTLALIYGGFTYTKSTTKAELGPISIDVKEQERVNIPLWLGVGGIAAGAVLLLAGAKKK